MGRPCFYAVACLGMLRLTSRKSGDRWTAVGHREELLRLVQRVRSSWGSMEERMLRAVTEAKVISTSFKTKHAEVLKKLKRLNLKDFKRL